MDSLKGLFGGVGGEDDSEVDPGQARARAEDFVDRYMSGNPAEGYSAEEAQHQFRRVLQNASPDQLQRAARQAVENLPADRRAEFNQMLQQRRAGQGGVDIQRTGESGAAQASGAGGDPLGGLLGGLLGGGGGLDDLLGGGGGSMGGLDDLHGGNLMGGFGDIHSSPMGKAIIGGIAAFAMKEMIDGDEGGIVKP